MSGEGAKERSDRVLLTPWVKFLWESYRNMLELLKNNSTVQSVYASVAKDAFKFCLNFQRRTEFRKLCDTVRIVECVCVGTVRIVECVCVWAWACENSGVWHCENSGVCVGVGR